jgi:hypothetical protein
VTREKKNGYTVSGIHIAQSFLNFNFDFSIVKTLPAEIPTYLAISFNVIRPSFFRSFRIFEMLDFVTSEAGLPECLLSEMAFLPLLNL